MRATFELETGTTGHARVVLGGRLTMDTVADVWEGIVEPLRATQARELVVDASALSYCDGAGVGLLIELQRIAADNGGRAEIRGLSAELEPLVRMASLGDPSASQLGRPRRGSIVTKVGETAVELLADIRQIVTITGEVTAAFAWAIMHPRRVRWGDMWHVAEKVGVNAVPVVALLGFLIGAIIAFQTAAPLRRFGADADVFVADIVAASVLRELGPLIAAILVAGRSGSAFAAEIGTMKVTEEVDALTTLGLSPVRFLILPRVLAAVLMAPLLALLADLVGLLGGYMVFASFGYPLATFVNRMLGVVDYVDLLGGLFKMFVFAFLIAAVGCLRGLGTEKGPGAVGDSTTRAVVAGIVLIIIADGILGTAYFYLGI
jgi:phospholipid/cholesterol/gamma-HCH transport system permease protein